MDEVVSSYLTAFDELNVLTSHVPDSDDADLYFFHDVFPCFLRGKPVNL